MMMISTLRMYICIYVLSVFLFVWALHFTRINTIRVVGLTLSHSASIEKNPLVKRFKRLPVLQLSPRATGTLFGIVYMYLYILRVMKQPFMNNPTLSTESIYISYRARALRKYPKSDDDRTKKNDTREE